MTPLRRAALLGLSLLVIAVGLGLDFIRPGGDPGIGPLQIGMGLAGLAGVILGTLPPPARTYYARGLLALGAAYSTALALEIFLTPPIARWGLITTSEQGLVQPSSWGGFELTPGWRGRYEDGVRPVEIAINALGDRDELPSAHDFALAERVLLLGDSYTFGVGLEKEETIEAQIERQSAGRAVAYNLGVGGYGPGDTLEHYRERPAFPATHTFFLIYGNDLRRDNCTAGLHTAVDGEIVPRARADGSPYTREDVERELESARREDGRLWMAQARSALTLPQLRARLLGGDGPLSSGSPDQYTLECALAAAERAEEMRAIARARGERFAVVILPTPAEAQRQSYFERMQACILELARRSIPTLEVRAELTVSDYFQHHEHLDPSGAAKVARAILASVESAQALR